MQKSRGYVMNIRTSLRSMGSVTLVGAGPGDPELLTLKAVSAIARATIVFVDDLVNPEILQHVSPHARVVHVGKRGGCKSTPQAFIHKLMVKAFEEGEAVVRLKGGDPFIFGRGGEEVEHLRSEGIEPLVINGITSGLAGMSSLGASLTHRDWAHGVVFVTGHAKPGDEGTNWAQLSETAYQAKLTLVIYMGVGSLDQIQAGLLHGLPPTTPVAVVQNASCVNQKEAMTTLQYLKATVTAHGLQSPSVIVVGDVVKTAKGWSAAMESECRAA